MHWIHSNAGTADDSENDSEDDCISTGELVGAIVATFFITIFITILVYTVVLVVLRVMRSRKRYFNTVLYCMPQLCSGPKSLKTQLTKFPDLYHTEITVQKHRTHWHCKSISPILLANPFLCYTVHQCLYLLVSCFVAAVSAH